ncbi:MAG: polysaccharide deacetylase family protein [Firmicutes bacterium]|nr:polysaccharide deacetylase family protein [Bacillota bacterium]MDY2720198.1 polysaccharide deacetylase family protein [Candidatus Faecousia sp.]
MKKLLISLGLCLCLALPCAAADGGCIALTFDDGPTGKYTKKMLDILEEKGVCATFFLCGYRVEQYPELTERIAADGHEIGLHGCSHHYFTQMCEEELNRELTCECYEIAEISGQAPALLRPPGGLTAKELPEDSLCRQFPIILWSVDPLDWATHDSAAVVRRVTKNVRAGDIILMHDSSDSSAEAAGQIIDALQKRGFTFLTVSQLAQQYGATLEGGRSYSRFS